MPVPALVRQQPLSYSCADWEKRKDRASDGAAPQVCPGEDPSPEYDLDKHTEGSGSLISIKLVIGVSQKIAK
jgi:hypothetical protein